MQKNHFAFTRTSIAVAVALVMSPGLVFADDVKDLTSPDVREVSVRVQNLDKVNPEMRMYSGMNRTGAYGGLDINLISRSPDGFWTNIQSTDLGMTGNQQIGGSLEKQGDWRIGLDYSEMTKYAPYTVNTNVTGTGTGVLNLNQDFRSFNGLGPVNDLQLKRTATSVMATKTITDNFKINFSFKGEKKTGAIMGAANGNSRTGLTPANAGVPVAGKTYATEYYAPEPENYQHNEFSASLDYFTKQFQLTGGYYGSFFTNDNTSLNIRPGQSDPAAAGTTASTQVPWISMAPNNRMQQFYVSGNYVFSPATRASFKATSSTGVQESAFIPNSVGGVLNPAGVPYSAAITNTNLGGLVKTTSLAARVTSRLSTNLDLMASWRNEDRKDQTPVRQYLTAFTNVQESHKTDSGKLELGYRLSDEYRLIGGIDYDKKQTPNAPRDQVSEQTVKGEIRKSMSDTLNGSFAISHGDRTGSAWNLSPADLSGATVSFPTATNAAAPLHFSDRKRDKVKAMVDWSPSEPVSLQFFYEHSEDKYQSAPPGPVSGTYPLSRLGMTSGKNDLLGLDISYAVNKDWRVNGYYSLNQYKTHQNELQTPRPSSGAQSCAGAGVITNGTLTSSTTCVPWTADLDMNGEVFGAGVKGSMGVWDLDAKFFYAKDWTKYNIAYTGDNQYSQTASGAGVLPDTVYTLNRLHVAGSYKVSKATRVRLDVVYDQRKVQDYAWAGWTFSDGTAVTRPASQNAWLFGVTLTQAF